MHIYKRIARSFPDLKLKLRQARMADTPEYYVQKTVFLSFLSTLSLMFLVFGFTKSPKALLAAPIIFFIAFFYLIHYVDYRIKKIENEISKEIVFAGRFLLVELESGVPMFNSFKNMAEQYEAIGKYFGEIVERVELGTPLDEALNETINTTPSADLRRLLWQLLNTLKTGSGVSEALTSVFDQIVREQQIAVKEYGRKLNPLAMFYMMVAVIVPSLGTIMLVILTTFVGLDLGLIIFFVIIGLIWFIQFMFLAMIKSSRPPVDM